MLLKAEKILTNGEILMFASESDIYNYARRELSEKILDGILTKDLMKIQIVKEMNEDLGEIIKIRATTRVYNPDD